MADYASVLRKAVEGLADNTAKTRADLYAKARGALQRQLEALGDRMSRAQMETQLAALDRAAVEVESDFAAQDADESLAVGLEDALGSLSGTVDESAAVAPPEPEEAEARAEAGLGTGETEAAGAGAATAEDSAEAAAPVEEPSEAGQSEPADDAHEPDTTDAGDGPDVSATDPEAGDAAMREEMGAAETEDPASVDRSDEDSASGDETRQVAEAVVATAPGTGGDDEQEAVETASDAATPADDENGAGPDADAVASEDQAETETMATRLAALDDEEAEPGADAVDAAAGEADARTDVSGDQAGTDEEHTAAAANDGGDEAKAAPASLAFATKSRLAEAFGAAESRFGTPRVSPDDASDKADPIDRVRSAVDELSAQAKDSERKEPSVIPFSGPTRATPPEAAAAAAEPGPAVPPTRAANDPAPAPDDLRAEPIEIPGEGESSKAWIIWLGVALIVAGGGAWGYVNRDTVMPVVQSWTQMAREFDETAERTEAPKIDDRVPAADGSGNDTETAAADDAGADTAAEPQATGDQTTDEPAVEPAAPATDAAEADLPAADAAETPQPVPPPVGEQAILYEEAAAEGGNDLAYTGAIAWETTTETSASGAPETVLVLDTTSPMRGVTLSMSIRKNDDEALPASHTIELMFQMPADYPYGAVANIGGILMKTAEPERGQALIGAAARVTDSFFIVGLSALENDREVNMELLRHRPWIDIPVVFETGKRGIFTLAKGETGQAAFEEAFAAWGN